MAREVDIDYAISETLKSHPDFVPYLSNILYKNIYNGTNPRNFTTRVRKDINTARQFDFVKYLLSEAIIIYNAAYTLSEEKEDNLEDQNNNSHFPMFDRIKKAIGLLKDKENNTIIYYLYNRIELFELIEAICKTTFKPQWYATNNIERDTRNNFHRQLEILASKNSTTKTYNRMLNKEYNAIKGIKNLEINYDAINICQREIMLGNQVRNAHNTYALGSCLFATQDVGKKRKNQEDSVLILEHIENPNFKIMAVADGMGGLNAGEVASSYVVSELSKWFNSLSSDYYEYPKELQIAFSSKLMKISEEIYEQFGSSKHDIKGGSTFTGAIIAKDKTIICSVGDSRAYALKEDDIVLLTNDESQVWDEMRKTKKGEPITTNDVDRLRLAPGNNVITRCMGDKRLEYIQSLVIDNESYDKLLLFTDGITDILSTDDIQFLSSTSKPEDLTEVFVNYVNNHGIKKQLINSNHEIEVVSPGKDNSSAVAYIRR